MQKLYDDEKTNSIPGQHDDLGVDGKKRKSEVEALQRDFDASSDYEPEELKASEEQADGTPRANKAETTELGQLGAGYSPDQPKEKSNGFISRLAPISRRNKLIGGGTIGAVLLGIVISAFIALPLKVQHMANNLQQQFYASAEQATEQMLEVLVQNYIADYLIPGMIQNNCTSTLIDDNCVSVSK